MYAEYFLFSIKNDLARVSANALKQTMHIFLQASKMFFWGF